MAEEEHQATDNPRKVPQVGAAHGWIGALVCTSGGVEGYSFFPQPLSFICAANRTEHPALDLITSHLGASQRARNSYLSLQGPLPLLLAWYKEAHPA